MPVGNVVEIVLIWVLSVVDLLPAPVDVAENIGRMKRKNQERKEAEDNSKADNRSIRRLVGPADLLIAFPKKK